MFSFFPFLSKLICIWGSKSICISKHLYFSPSYITTASLASFTSKWWNWWWELVLSQGSLSIYLFLHLHIRQEPFQGFDFIYGINIECGIWNSSLTNDKTDSSFEQSLGSRDDLWIVQAICVSGTLVKKKKCSFPLGPFINDVTPKGEGLPSTGDIRL